MKNLLALSLLLALFVVPAHAETTACKQATETILDFKPFFNQLFEMQKAAPPDLQREELADIGVLLKDADAIGEVCNVPGEAAGKKAYMDALSKFRADMESMKAVLEEEIKQH